MRINELRTPTFLVDLDILKSNIKNYQKKVKDSGYKIYPMTKTHKSTSIAQMQLEEGADGLLVGTIDEALKFSQLDVDEIVLAYPIIGNENLELIAKLKDRTNIVLSLDSLESARIYNKYYESIRQKADFLLLVNSGLDRLGVVPDNLMNVLPQILKECEYLNFRGIATHAGQVYQCQSYAEVKEVAEVELDVLSKAKNTILSLGIKDFEVHSGTTPTFDLVVDSGVIDVFRPGNYVYHDAIQVALGVKGINDCALTIQATIISNPEPDKYIIDVGSKCLGLDKGAHGNSAIKGYGMIKDCDGVIESISEEVGIIRTCQNYSVGDTIRIIPNHACSANNMTNYLVAHSQEEVIKLIEVDVRSNSIKPI